MRCSLRPSKPWMRLAAYGTLVMLALVCTILQATFAFAQNANGPYIFDVRKNLPLEPEEPVYHDFYISSGSEAGFKKGMYVSIVRHVPVHDPIQNKQQGILQIPVGKLQVIHVDRSITVARLQSTLDDEERPTLEFEGIMIGDRVDLGSLTMQAPPAKKKAKTARADVSTPAVATAPVKTAEPTVEIKGESQAASQPATSATADAVAASPSENAPQATELASVASESEDPNLAPEAIETAKTSALRASKKDSSPSVSVPVPAPVASAKEPKAI